MYRENSWDDSNQRLEELFKLTSLDRFVAHGSGEWFGTIAFSRSSNCILETLSANHFFDAS